MAARHYPGSFRVRIKPAMLLPLNDKMSLGRILLPLGAGLVLLTSLLRAPAQAETTTFIINSNEGYGIIDCLTDGSACGKPVADAWCEAHQMKQAVAFGLASDITGSIGEKTRKPEPGDVIVACRD
jgi:hypothetical protein